MFYGKCLEFLAANLGASQLLMLRGKWQTEAFLAQGNRAVATRKMTPRYGKTVI